MKNKIKENKEVGLLTSFKDLDSILQGIQKSDLIDYCRTSVNGKNSIFIKYWKKYC